MENCEPNNYYDWRWDNLLSYITEEFLLTSKKSSNDTINYCDYLIEGIIINIDEGNYFTDSEFLEYFDDKLNEAKITMQPESDYLSFFNNALKITWKIKQHLLRDLF